MLLQLLHFLSDKRTTPQASGVAFLQRPGLSPTPPWDLGSHSVSGPYEARRPKRYFPNTFFTSPTLFCTLPATFSVVPRSRRSRLPIAFPASSLTFPLASWIRPLILSSVLEFIHLIRASRRVGAGL